MKVQTIAILALALTLASLQGIRSAALSFEHGGSVDAMRRGMTPRELSHRQRLAPLAPEFSPARRLFGQAAMAAYRAVGGPWLSLAGPALVDAARWNPVDAETVRSLALVAHHGELPDAALGFARAGLRRGPMQAGNHWGLARLLGPGPERDAAFRQAARLQPDLTPEILAENGLSDAEPELAVRILPGSALVWRTWAEAVTDTARRAAIARIGLRESPQAGVHAGHLAYFVGADLLRSGETQAALDRLEQANVLAPDEQAILRNLGFARLEAGRLEEARTAFEQSIARYGDVRNGAWLGLARTLATQGDPGGARRILDRLATHPGLEPWLRHQAGVELARLRKRN